jgi:hypothetical protein
MLCRSKNQVRTMRKMINKYMFGKDKIERTQSGRRTFKYTCKGITLEFTLGTDTPNDLETFAELLTIAHQDVQVELAKLKQ